MRHAVAFALVLSSLAACGPDGRDDGSGGGGGGGSGSGSGSGSGAGGENCDDSAKFIYTVDTNNQFSRFDASTKTFTDLGTLSCPAGSASPFSMSVDRNTIAWVLYNNGSVFRVDINGNLACTATNWSSNGSLFEFGMGFSSNTAGSVDDTLFVAGGSTVSSGSSTLATLDTTTMTATNVGTVQGWPELTGNGNAELWGWFPDASSPRVEQINKANGAAIKTFPLPSLAGEPLAWAFAFWGGDYWIFLEKADDFGFPEGATTVYQIDGQNGSIKSTTPTSSREIVGAGVSTCAPTVIL